MELRPWLCGICFGIYPILANRSKLGCAVMFFIFSIVGMLFATVPFIMNGTGEIKTATSTQISLGVASACVSGLGIILMFCYLSVTPVEKAGSLVIIMMLSQIIVTLITSSMFARTLPSPRQAIGATLAIAAIFFLSPK